MKIRRGIESRYAASSGEGPRIGRVARVRDTVENNDASQSLGRGRRYGPLAGRRKLVAFWSVTLSLTTLLLVGGLMFFWLRRHANGDPGGSNSTVQNVRIVSKFASPSEDEALAIVRKAIAVKEAKQVDRYFHRGTATPEEVVGFNQDSENRDGTVSEMVWLGSMDLEGLLVDGVLVSYNFKEGIKQRLAYLVPDEMGVWKLDFEGFARVSRPSWADLLSGRADHSQVRVFVTSDSYFNGPFIDESQWVCFAMASPETKDLLPEEKEILHGYCKVESRQAKAMARILSGENRLRRATLEIRRSTGGDARQFEIVRVMSEDWVLAPKPYDERAN
jgi:hypothetical protein